MTFGFGLGLTKGGGAGGLPAFAANFIGGSLPTGSTFSRGTIGTFYNQSGLIATASTDVARFDYDPGNMLQQNLLTYSNDFTNAIWAAGSPVSYTLIPGAITGPDGTASGTQITSVSGVAATCRNFTATSTTATFSIYVKQGTTPTSSTNFLLRNGTTAVQLSSINLAGSVATGTSSIMSVGNGWYRVVLTATTGISIGDTLGLYYGATGSVVPGQYWYLYGGQLNEGSTALPYLATTSTAQTVCAPRGLLIEEARTNAMFPSQTISVWTLNGTGSVADNTLVSPDGATDASQITATTNGSGCWKSTTVTTATVYTASLYLKAISGGSTILVGTDVGVAVAATLTFNMLTGAITSPGASVTSSGATYVGNGWWRVWWTFTTNSTTSDILAYGSAGQVYGMYGAQLEAGAYATSYIPTTSATVTRNFDNLSITSTNFASWFNQTTGTFAIQYDVGCSYATAPAAFTVNPGAGFNAAATGNARWWNSSTNVSTANAVTTLNTTRKEAMAYAASSRAICLNGGAVASDANVPFPGALTGMYFGSAYGGGTQNINGHILSFSYYNYTLTNAQLQGITT